MSTITADPTLLLVLSQMKEVTEIRDTNGNIVGIYTPKALTADDVRKMFDLKKVNEKLEKEGHKTRPFREMVDKLKKLDKDAAKRKKRARKSA